MDVVCDEVDVDVCDEVVGKGVLEDVEAPADTQSALHSGEVQIQYSVV